MNTTRMYLSEALSLRSFSLGLLTVSLFEAVRYPFSAWCLTAAGCG